jgi:hypothetical protein
MIAGTVTTRPTSHATARKAAQQSGVTQRLVLEADMF